MKLGSAPQPNLLNFQTSPDMQIIAEFDAQLKINPAILLSTGVTFQDPFFILFLPVPSSNLTLKIRHLLIGMFTSVLANDLRNLNKSEKNYRHRRNKSTNLSITPIRKLKNALLRFITETIHITSSIWICSNRARYKLIPTRI
ncbi:hypothetical protein ACTXT7_012402 [Hymenolepis weldensis]